MVIRPRCSVHVLRGVAVVTQRGQGFEKGLGDDGAAERGGGGGLGQCVRGRPGEFFHQHLAEIDRWAWVWMGYIQRGICAEDVL